MTIEDILSKDFAALVEKFRSDGFAERALTKLASTDRLRLVAIGGAGAVGAAIAASQFGAAADAFAAAAPILSTVSIANTEIALGAGPVLAALLFAAVGGATAIIAPGWR